LSDALPTVRRDVPVVNKEGLHARPVMLFVALASKFRSTVEVANISRRAEPLDGKSAMDMMLLEATHGNILRIVAIGDDAQGAVDALSALVARGFADGEERPKS